MNPFIKSAIKLFNEKGIKFTLNELATINKMSKKTIYKIYGDKEAVIRLSIIAVFKSIKEEEKEIFQSKSLTTIEKLKAIICVFPSFSVNYNHVDEIKTNYPDAYKEIHQHLESGWDSTKAIVKQAVREGVLEPLDFDLLKLILVGLFNEIVGMDEDVQKETLKASLDMILKGYSKE